MSLGVTVVVLSDSKVRRTFSTHSRHIDLVARVSSFSAAELMSAKGSLNPSAPY